MPIRGRPDVGARPLERSRGADGPAETHVNDASGAPAAPAPPAADADALATLASSRFREVVGLLQDNAPAPSTSAAAGGPSVFATRLAAMQGDDLSRDAGITRELVVLAEELRSAETPGVELWGALLSAAAEANLARSDLTPREQLDATIAQITAVVVGSDAGGHLGTFNKLARFIPGATDPLAAKMRELASELGEVGDRLSNSYSLDSAGGDDFAAAFRDGSKGQVGHTHFYVFIGYAVGRRDPLLAHLPNTYHETVDPSSTHKTKADWLAGAWGIEVGRLLRLLRDGGEAEGALRALPSIVRGAFGAAPAGADAIASEVRGVVEENLERPVEGGVVAKTINSLARGLASITERLRG
jgi:hypothetical protein